jgi:peptidoglycan hydrolase-like protein with peptidoglycan-binding domain
LNSGTGPRQVTGHDREVIRLRIPRFYKGQITGIADKETVKAIMDFQKSERIPDDGALGPRTKSRLHKDVCY